MNNILVNFKKEECCGCTACKSICPKQAITMKEDEKGFFYPFVDETKCINCGLCIQSCDFRKFKPTTQDPKAYLFQLKDEDDRMESQSGGAFIALARYVISKGGCVFGCELNENLVAIHTHYDTFEDIDKFRGSKYVQSNLKDTFLECYEKLNEGKLVLFSGTGCQVHGLISFLKYKKCNTAKLITCDIVCHGCPSPKVFETYKKILGKENKSNISEFKFRNKDNNGWHSCKEKIVFKNSKILEVNRWATIFYKRIIFRDSCFNCKYTTTNRLTDFTVCDAWRTDKQKDKFDDNKGTSLILTHTINGEDIIKKLSNSLERITKKEYETYKQPQLINPPDKGIEYNYFWNSYLKNNVLTFNLFTKNTFIYRLLRKISRVLIWKKK